MADATFSDVVKAQQETNEILRQQAIADGKPDPKKFIKEEFIAIAAQRGYAKKDRELQTKTAKTVSSSEKKDQEYYKKQLEEQTDTTGEQKVTSSHLSDHVSNLKNLPIYLLSLLKATGVADAERRRLGRAARISSAAKKEEENKTKFRDTKLFKGIAGLGKGIGKVVGSLGSLLKDKAKAGAKGIFGILKKLALGGLAIAALAFLNNPKFAETMKFIRDDVIPVVGKFLENVIKPLWKNIKIAFFDVLESLGKFFNDPGLKETMDLLRKGDLFGAFMKFAGTIFKPDGLIDNLATNLTNLFLSIFGLEPIDGKETVFSMIGKQFRKFYAQFQNTFRQLINDAFKFLKIPKRLDMIDENTGKNIESEYNKKIREEEEEKAERIKAIIAADPELQKQQAKVAAMTGGAKEKDIQKAFTLRRKKIDAEEEFKKNIEKRQRQIDNKEIAEKRMVSRSFDARIGKLQNQLDIARKLGIEKPSEKKFIDRIKLLENEIARIKSEQSNKGARVINSGNTQVSQTKDESTTVYGGTKFLSPVNPVINQLQVG